MIHTSAQQWESRPTFIWTSGFDLVFLCDDWAAVGRVVFFAARPPESIGKCLPYFRDALAGIGIQVRRRHNNTPPHRFRLSSTCQRFASPLSLLHQKEKSANVKLDRGRAKESIAKVLVIDGVRDALFAALTRVVFLWALEILIFCRLSRLACNSYLHLPILNRILDSSLKWC